MAKGHEEGHNPNRKVGREEYVQGVFNRMHPAQIAALVSGSPEGHHGIMFNQQTGETFSHGPYASKEEAQEANYGQNSAYDFGDVTHMDTGYSDGEKKNGY